jgi:hypothetical protein
MIHELAKNLNFKVSFNPLIVEQKRLFYTNRSLDLYVQMVELGSQLAYKYVLTKPFVFHDDVVVVPPGEEFSGYEKMLLPFDSYTWGLIMFTFVTAFTTIFILNLTTLQIQSFVYGKNVKTPSLNILAVLFGISQIILPGRTFGRFLVINFVIFCLILRTAWQGKLFEFMQKDLRQQEIQSIEEIIEKNFTLYTSSENFQFLYKDMDIAKR